MNAAEFKKLSTKHLAPKLREKGWKGSGFNFYRITSNNIIQIFGIQGSWMGGSVCCETAIHFDFLPDLAGKQDPSKGTYAGCIIRNRLSPKGEGDYHWQFSNDDEKNVRSLEQIVWSLETHGEKFYKNFENFPHPFDKIKPSDLKDGKRVKLFNKNYTYFNVIDLIWLLREINLKIGRPKTANEFVEVGIDSARQFYRDTIKKYNTKKHIELAQKTLDIRIKQLSEPLIK